MYKYTCMTQLFERTQWRHDYYTTRKKHWELLAGLTDSVSQNPCNPMQRAINKTPSPPNRRSCLPAHSKYRRLLSNIRDRCQKDFVYKVVVDKEHRRCVHYFYKRQNIESFYSHICPETYIVYT